MSSTVQRPLTPALCSRRCLGLLLLPLVCLSPGCPSSSQPQVAWPIADVALDPGRLYVPYDVEEFADNPELLGHIRESPYAYFRFINIPFAQTVCERFFDDLPILPTVNLHGDAHLEQYAVTGAGRGLADFDDASSGPAVIDIVRFGVSIRLASRELGFADQSDAILTAFIDGYAEALVDPEFECTSPAFAARLRASLSDDPEPFLAWANTLMAPVDPEFERTMLDAFGRYVVLMAEQYPELEQSFFDIVRYGALRMGVGSALDTKFLIRVQGYTEDPLDDVILEAKQIRDLSGIGCLHNTMGGGAFRILIGQARIGGGPAELLGYVPRGGPHTVQLPFWLQSWRPDYRELSLAGSALTVDDLTEIAFDVGVQLGRGHVLDIASPYDRQLRQAQSEMLVFEELAIRQAVDDMAQMTLNGWARFVSDIE